MFTRLLYCQRLFDRMDMKKEGVVRLVRIAVREAGSQSQAARVLGVSRQAISDALGPREFISPCLVAALGLERVWTYRVLASSPNTTPAPATAKCEAQR